MKNLAGTLPKRFVPRFWEDADGREAVIKRIKRRVERLKQDVGADSYQKEILCERAAFVVLQLETAERAALEDGRLDMGTFTQMTNCLLGLLKSLGLERQVQAVGLKGYIAGRAG